MIPKEVADISQILLDNDLVDEHKDGIEIAYKIYNLIARKMIDKAIADELAHQNLEF